MSSLPSYGVPAPGPDSMVTLTLPGPIYDKLQNHLFPGDRDEHGAVILAGIARTSRGVRLLAREVVTAVDGIDYVEGTRGYRMLTGEFVTRQIRRARDERLVYLAIHNHGGTDRVGFSSDDLASQDRGYPTLLDIARGMPVGALVFAERAIAGRIWFDATRQVPLRHALVLRAAATWLHPAPPALPPRRAAAYDRQARIFGDRGQDLLARLRVGVIGAGGVGSIVVELLTRLGVGQLVVADPDRLDLTNVPRVVGSTRSDAFAMLTEDSRPAWIQHLGKQLAARKVDIMRRLARTAGGATHVEAIAGDIVDEKVARRFVDCDYLFLAADSMQARLVFNSLVHAYLIPGVMAGTKVPVDPATGEVGEVFVANRSVTSSGGCLLCNGLIPASRLQEETESASAREMQRYVDEPNIPVPSVITLNAVAASHAVNEFLFYMTGLTDCATAPGFFRYEPRRRRMIPEQPSGDPTCLHCGAVPESRFSRGDAADLGTRQH